MQDYNDEGIKFYTGSAWQNQHVDAGAKFSKEMSDLIREKAAGSFLWARLAVDEAVQGVLAGTPREQLLRDLTKLPTDIRAMYEDMLNRLPNAMQTAAIIMLRLIDAAGGQLELDKLCAAFASAIRHADIETPILFSDLSADSTALVLGLLGGFIDVVKADLPVREKLCVRFESSTLQIRSNDSAMIKFSHETLRALCSHSVWLNHRTPSSFLTMYPDNLWLRLYTAEMVACKCLDDHVVCSISEALDALLQLERLPWQVWTEHLALREREVIALLQRWPAWTALLPHALEGIHQELSVAWGQAQSLPSCYEEIVSCNVLMLHCAICRDEQTYTSVFRP